VAADSKRHNLLNLGQKQGLGQVISKFFATYFSPKFLAPDLSNPVKKKFSPDTPIRFAFKDFCQAEFNLLTFAQAILLGKTYPQVIHK
jgi:hypothetical protein